jgi:hypothetical protein
MMMTREDQTAWLVDLLIEEQEKCKLPIVVLGKSFKPETNLTVGSPASLFMALLGRHVKYGNEELSIEHYDPYVDKDYTLLLDKPNIYFIATKHRDFAKYLFASGSVVIDPFRYISDQAGVQVIRIGEGKL